MYIYIYIYICIYIRHERALATIVLAAEPKLLNSVYDKESVGKVWGKCGESVGQSVGKVCVKVWGKCGAKCGEK